MASGKNRFLTWNTTECRYPKIPVAHWIGALVCELHACRSGANVKKLGLHNMPCSFSAGRIAKHAELNNVVTWVNQTSGVPCLLKPPGLPRDFCTNFPCWVWNCRHFCINTHGLKCCKNWINCKLIEVSISNWQLTTWSSVYWNDGTYSNVTKIMAHNFSCNLTETTRDQCETFQLVQRLG